MTGWDPDTNTYYINGNATTLDQCGNGLWNAQYYIDGQQVFDGTGWSSCASVYFVGGTSTTLNSNGNGYWNSYYYISGSQTSLDSCGNGYWFGSPYVEGVVSFAGYSSCSSTYYVSGTGTTLDSSGNGYWNSYYYISGSQTSLDSCGNGSWNGNYYIDGSQNSNGWSSCGSTYYINGTATSLPQSGTGWDTISNSWYWAGVADSGLDSNGTGLSSTYGVQYYLGVLATEFYFGAGATDWNTISNWYLDSALSVVSEALPSGNSNIFILNNLTSNSSSLPEINKLLVSGVNAGSQVSLEININVNDAAVFINGIYGYDTNANVIVASGGLEFKETSVNNGSTNDPMTFRNNSYNAPSGYTVSSGYFYDSSYNNGAVQYALFRNSSYNGPSGTINGDAIFKDRTYNQRGVAGVVTEDHNRGINGSNLLGLI